MMYILLCFALLCRAVDIQPELNASLIVAWKSSDSPASQTSHVVLTVTDFRNVNRTKCFVVSGGTNQHNELIDSSQRMPLAQTLDATPGFWTLTLRAFTTTRTGATCGERASGDGVEEQRSANFAGALEQRMMSDMTLSTAQFGATFSSTWNFIGLRAADNAIVGAGDALVVPLLAPSGAAIAASFKSVLTLQADARLVLAVDYNAKLAAALAFDNATFVGDLVLDISGFTPPSTTTPTQVTLANVFRARQAQSNSKYQFKRLAVLNALSGGFGVDANAFSVDASGSLLFQIVRASTTPMPSGGSLTSATTALSSTPSSTPPTLTTTTTLAVAATTTTSTVDVDDGFELFGFAGVVLYAIIGGVGLGLILCIVVIGVIVCVCVCRRKQRNDNAAFELGGAIDMRPTSSSSSVVAYSTLKDNDMPPPETMALPVGLPPALALDARSGAYPQPKTIVGEDIEF